MRRSITGSERASRPRGLLSSTLTRFSFFEPGTAQFRQQRLRRHSQFLRRPRLVPLALPQSVLEQDAFDVTDGPPSHFLQVSFPTELLGQHSARQAGSIRFRRRQLQSLSRNAESIGKNHGAFHRVLKFAHISWPAILQQSLPRFIGKLQSRFLERPAEFLEKM